MPFTAETLISVVEADVACRTHLGNPPDTRFYPGRLPQKPSLPAATYQRIGGTRVDSFEGRDGLDNGLYQIDVYAASAKAAAEAATAMADAIDASAELGATFLNMSDAFEDQPDPRLYRVTMDVSLWHAEG
jgi:hypothetical protein